MWNIIFEKIVSPRKLLFYKLRFPVNPFVGLNYESLFLMQYFVCRWVAAAQVEQHLGFSATVVFALVRWAGSIIWHLEQAILYQTYQVCLNGSFNWHLFQKLLLLSSCLAVMLRQQQISCSSGVPVPPVPLTGAGPPFCWAAATAS